MDLKTPDALRSVGIRVSPTEVYFAVAQKVDEGTVELLTSSSIRVPPALTLPEQLSFVRTTVLDIINEYRTRHAGIRLAEPTARQTSVERRNLEGVVQELLSSSEVECYFAGAIAKLSGLLDVEERTQVKKYFEGADFMGVTDWKDASREERESIVTAVAALNLPENHA